MKGMLIRAWRRDVFQDRQILQATRPDNCRGLTPAAKAALRAVKLDPVLKAAREKMER